MRRRGSLADRVLDRRRFLGATVALLASPGSVRFRSVRQDIQSAISAARPGANIVIPNGHYLDWEIEVPCIATAEQPISIRAETDGGVILSGWSGFHITGRHVVITGMAFHDADPGHGLLVFDGSESCRVTGCRIDHAVRNHQAHGDAAAPAAIWFTGTASHNRFDHGSVNGVAWRNVAVQIRDSADSGRAPVDNRIDHNVFLDNPKGTVHETVQVGQNQRQFGDVYARTLVDHNQFVRCDGDAEIISNKSSGNEYSSNIFVECDGELTLRGGHDCLVDGNRLERCSGGIRLSGTRHTITNNVVYRSGGTGIRLKLGTMPGSTGGVYPPVSECLIQNNTIYEARSADVQLDSVGERGSGIPPESNRVLDNILVGSQGTLLSVGAIGSNVIEGNVLFSTGAEIGTPGDDALLQDPRFLDASVGDLRLRSDSPARRAGLSESPAEHEDRGAPANVASPPTGLIAS